MQRRRVLKAGLAAGSLFLPLPYAMVWAQSEGAVKLLRLPKIALIFGNSKYKDAPLKNPANDAKAIGEALSSLGFSVVSKLDSTKAEMAAALDAHVKDLAAKKCVGLFYYAGHGVQLAWKNYMLPVDAEIDTIDDVQKKAVEVHTLTEGLARAANPLNVIILDACRDNPFGTAKQPQARGLSQMDAPGNTILAYATSPGNVASDGEGANGLYTENFLRELKVPEAKIEDIFKRVRLAVRRRSNGAQIPWESTSLEDDFWFIPPKSVQPPGEAEKDRRFEEELALWEKIKGAPKPEPLEDFLRRYPSGPFSELAQLALDQLLARLGERRVRIASQEGNPFTKGSAEANTAWKAGDRYVYRRIDRLVREERQTEQIVVEVAGGEVRYSNGQVTDLLGNTLRRGGAKGRVYTPNQLEPLEYVVGKQWNTQFRVTTGSGSGLCEMEMRIVTREPVTVPAGTFNAYRIEGKGVLEEESGRVEMTRLVKWAAPDRLRREVAMEETRQQVGGGGGGGGGRGGGGGGGGGRGRGGTRVTQMLRWELESFVQS